MVKVKNRKLVVIGNSGGFTVPSEVRQNLDKEKLYDLDIEESKEVTTDGSVPRHD